ncbi:hypothetical protein IR145_16555 [Streptococcus danieliae]|nr:hypothetical protein [Streptococcus danieliae]
MELAKKIQTEKLQGDFFALQFFERADIKNLNFFFVCSQEKEKAKNKKSQENNFKNF